MTTVTEVLTAFAPIIQTVLFVGGWVGAMITVHVFGRL